MCWSTCGTSTAPRRPSGRATPGTGRPARPAGSCGSRR
nr:MAG TPA: hypothetical protein [Bacteriophage sp.]